MNSWLPNPHRVVIIGGGLSGLSAAHTLLKYSKIPCEVKIIEAQSRVGGWVQSSRFDDGTIMEHGPRTARSYGSAAIHALNILSDLEIEKHIVGIPNDLPAAKKRFIYANGNICELPSSFLSLLFKREPFSKALMSSLIREIFVKKGSNEDESVYNFFKRRFNKELAEYMCDPLCKGIFGGDARKLSLKSCFPILFNYEQNHGSIIKGGLFTKSPKIENNSDIVRQAKLGKWMAWTLKNGIETLPEIWSEYLKNRGVDIILNSSCEQITFKNDNRIQCVTNNGIYECERVISTISAPRLHTVIKDSDEKLSKLLKSINYATMAVITLQYKNIKLPVEGFGILIPSSEDCDILGITFDSLVIPHLSAGDTTVLTVMAGGAWFDELFGCPDNVDIDKVKDLAVRSVQNILGIKDVPFRTVCKIQKQCIPQYEVHHQEKVEKINDHVKTNNVPLNIVGNMSGGVSVNDVIVNARNETLKWLSSNHMY